MPTPIGHALAGLTIAGPTRRATAAACLLAAVMPDFDILIGSHRTYSHSFAFAVLTGVAVALTAKTLGKPSARLGLLCGAAYASHVLLDWLGKDTADPRGVMALWPVSRAYFVSGLDLFPEVSRRYWKADEFIWGNLRSMAIELLILGPPCLTILWWRRRRATGSRT